MELRENLGCQSLLMTIANLELCVKLRIQVNDKCRTISRMNHCWDLYFSVYNSILIHMSLFQGDLLALVSVSKFGLGHVCIIQDASGS